MAYETFQARREELYNLLDAAEHSVSYAAHLMEIDPSNTMIDGYEAALDYAFNIRRLIGENADAEDAKRSADAGLVASKHIVYTEKNTFSFSHAYKIHENKALGK